MVLRWDTPHGEGKHSERRAMSRVKDPVEKKRLSLARDHRVFALEGNKTFRKAWRLKKARAARKLRRKKVDQSAPKPKRSLEKYGVMTLAQSISFKGGEIGSRWNPKVLGKNKEALRAASRSAKKRSRRKG
jgi:hypothetical protein